MILSIAYRRRDVAQLVERKAGGLEVAGSSPVVPTTLVERGIYFHVHSTTMHTTFRSSLLVLGFLTPSLALATFSDVPTYHLYGESIGYVSQEGIAKGYADGTFRPDDSVNRAEFTKLIIETFLKEKLHTTDTTELSFSDTPEGSWYMRYLRTAVASNLIQGYSDNSFKPANPVTFAEAAKILARISSPDTAQGNPWYEPFVQDLEVEKAIPPTIVRFDQPISRSEMAEMLWRIQKKITSEPSQTMNGIKAGKIAVPVQQVPENFVAIESEAGTQKDYQGFVVVSKADYESIKQKIKDALEERAKEEGEDPTPESKLDKIVKDTLYQYNRPNLDFQPSLESFYPFVQGMEFSVIVNGVLFGPYENVADLTFGSHSASAFVAGNNGKFFAVLNGKEIGSYDGFSHPPLQSTFVPLPSGKAFTYVVINNDKLWLVINGKEIASYKKVPDSSMSFYRSSLVFDNNDRPSYVISENDKFVVVIGEEKGESFDSINSALEIRNGKVLYLVQNGQTEYLMQDRAVVAEWKKPEEAEYKCCILPEAFFSPDGKNAGYVYSSKSPWGYGVVVNGKKGPLHSGSIEKLSFTTNGSISYFVRQMGYGGISEETMRPVEWNFMKNTVTEGKPVEPF